MDREDPIGMKFGKLLVLDHATPNKWGRARYTCKCDCGNIHISNANDVKNGGARSCGECVERPRLPVGENARNLVYGRYRINAKKRGLSFNITKDELSSLICCNCTYCGIPPSNTCNPRTNIPFSYNGIDRVNNNIGYVINNLVPCCRTCNIAKRDMSRSEFLSWISRIYDNSIGLGTNYE